MASCETCKKGCKDEACRVGCGKQCASCRQGCVRTLDRCSSGTCSAEYEQCRKRLKAAWKSKGCSQVCDGERTKCEAKCRREKDADPGCAEGCLFELQNVKKKGCELGLCLQGNL